MAEEQPKFNPHEEIDSDRWGDMSLQDLYAQEIVLQRRIDFAVRVGNVPLAEQLQRGMVSLQTIIKLYNNGKEEPKVTIVDPYTSVTRNKK